MGLGGKRGLQSEQAQCWEVLVRPTSGSGTSEFIQSTVGSHGDILSRGLASCESHLRKASQTAVGRMDLRTAGLEGGSSLTQATDLGGKGRFSRSQDSEAAGFGGCLGVGAEEGGVQDDSWVPGLGGERWALR